MAVSHIQTAKASATDPIPTTVYLGSAPLDGSCLIAAVGLEGNNTVTGFRHSADWRLLYEAATAENTDRHNPDGVRVQIWGAFNVQDADSQVGFLFSGGTIEKGIVVAEYAGDVFQFQNPADRVVGDIGASLSGTTGPAESGKSDYTREAIELWVAAAAISKTVLWTSTTGVFLIRDQAVIGTGSFGAVCLLDFFASAVGQPEATVYHTATGSDMHWAITAAGIRGDIQIPAVELDAETVGEPVTENEDYLGDSVDRLLYQFKARQ